MQAFHNSCVFTVKIFNCGFSRHGGDDTRGRPSVALRKLAIIECGDTIYIYSLIWEASTMLVSCIAMEDAFIKLFHFGLPKLVTIPQGTKLISQVTIITWSVQWGRLGQRSGGPPGGGKNLEDVEGRSLNRWVLIFWFCDSANVRI